MGLLVLSLLCVLSPQDPAPNWPIVPGTGSEPVIAQAEDRVVLAELERAGNGADPQVLARLACSTNAPVAARAAWLLSRRKDRPAWEPLRKIASTSPHADARVHAMQALLGFDDVASTATGIAGLDDADRRVRTLAAQLLGKLQRPTAIEPLLALVDRKQAQAEPGPATDVQAALLALADLGAADALLRASVAVHDARVEGVGQALAYCCQQLVPKMSAERRRSFLLSAVAHRELLVRRFAIVALADSRDPAVVKALEGRLATEVDALRPLLEATLAGIRPVQATTNDGELARATRNVQAITNRASAYWQRLDNTQRCMVAAIPVVGCMLLLWWRARRRTAIEAASTRAVIDLVQPSEELLAQQEAAATNQADPEFEADAEAEGATPMQADAEQPYEHAGSAR